MIPLLVQICCIDIKASTLQSVPLNAYRAHESQLNKIITEIKERPADKKITLKRRPEQSHCPRPHAYKSSAVQLDISEFDKLLNVEYLSENEDLRRLIPVELRSRVNDEEIFAVADVQALMSMEQLVRDPLENK